MNGMKWNSSKKEKVSSSMQFSCLQGVIVVFKCVTWIILSTCISTLKNELLFLACFLLLEVFVGLTGSHIYVCMCNGSSRCGFDFFFLQNIFLNSNDLFSFNKTAGKVHVVVWPTLCVACIALSLALGGGKGLAAPRNDPVTNIYGSERRLSSESRL